MVGRANGKIYFGMQVNSVQKERRGEKQISRIKEEIKLVKST